MFNLGGYEVIAILAVALLVFGTRIPSVARSLGSAVVQFRKGLKGEEDQTPAKKE
ncbi:twin-arginine translocase TatA/TatE family subunit [bacterium]|nr:twin-arginine translocase TatA/TatE family subunit [bacterium]